jgi:hypothetical protein
MKSFSGKVMLAAACAGLAIVLTAGSALAGDRDGHRGGGHYDRGDHRGWSSHYDRYDHRFYRPYCYAGSYCPVYVEEAAYYPDPPVVYAEPAPAPVYVYTAPMYRERVVVRHAYRSWGVGFYYGR